VRAGLRAALALATLCALSAPALSRAQGAPSPSAPAEPALPPSAAPPSAAPPSAGPPSAPVAVDSKPSRSEKKAKRKGDKGAASDDDPVGLGRLSLGARLMMGFEYRARRPAGAQTSAGSSEYGFDVRQIRLSAKGDLADQFRLNVSFDLSDALSPDPGAGYDSPPYLRTATIEWRPAREYRLRVGRFKRPFSRLELESASTLPILRRGLFNGLALEDSQWGDRAIGVMASGRLDAPKLRWYLSLTNPGWSSTLATEGLDVTGRVEWTVSKGLVLGANAAYKNIEIGSDRVQEVAYGGDVALKLGDAHFLLESNDAPRTFVAGRPRALGALFMFNYEQRLSEAWGLEPVLFIEYADADTDVLQNESLRLAVGVNLLGYDGFRVMPQLELVRSIGDTSAENPWLESERLSLIFSLVL
jgi:phosphate-selective porin O/P